MSRLHAIFCSVLLAVLCQSSSAWAQSGEQKPTAPDPNAPVWDAEASQQRQHEPAFSARGALGFTANPGTFLMTVEMPWHLDEIVSVGPLLQLGVSDEKVYVAPTLQVYLHPRLDGQLAPFRPYGHAGMGFAYLDKDDRAPGRDSDDIDFQFTAGLGMEYAIREDFFLGTGLLFNVVPGGVVGQRFIFGWQLLTIRHAF